MPALKKLKPINILDSCNFRPERQAIFSALNDILLWARVPVALSLNDYGCWRHSRWKDASGQLVPYMSVDWYVRNAFDERRNQVCAEDLFEELLNEPWRDESLLGDHYDFFIIDDDLYTRVHTRRRCYAVEVADQELGVILSLSRLQSINALTFTLVRTAGMRAFAQLFRVPSIHRMDVDFDEEPFCKRRCIMSRARIAPRDWEALSILRLSRQPFCESCLEDLRNFFYQLHDIEES